jgi:Domain of unknown function (DUF222)
MSDVIWLARQAHHYLAIFDNGKAIGLYHTKRLASPGQRIVLSAKDRGCTRPGCDVSGYYCEVHHVEEWASTRCTDINKLTLACGCDHPLVKPGGWITRNTATATPNGAHPDNSTSRHRQETTKTRALPRLVNLRPVAGIYALTECLENRSQGQWQIAEEALSRFDRLTVEHDATQGESPPRVCPHERRPVRKELSPFLGAEVFGDKRNDLVFLVVEVFVDATRESLNDGHQFLRTPRVARGGPRGRGGPNSLTGIIDGAVRVLHPGQLGGSARCPGGQPWPHKPVLGRMMKMHRRHHEVDVLVNHRGASAVTGTDTAY